MSADPNALPLPEDPQPPQLLLDTNVYLDLPDGHLPAEGERLKAIAAHLDPPLLWSCQTEADLEVVRARRLRADRPKGRSLQRRGHASITLERVREP